MISIFKGSALMAGCSLLVGQAIDVQLSGAQVVGYAISIVGILLAGLISLVTYFASKKIDGIESTLAAQNTDLLSIRTVQIGLQQTMDGVVAWKGERQREHDEANKDHVKRLQAQLDRKRGE